MCGPRPKCIACQEYRNKSVKGDSRLCEKVLLEHGTAIQEGSDPKHPLLLKCMPPNTPASNSKCPGDHTLCYDFDYCTKGANGQMCQNGAIATGISTGSCGCACKGGFTGANCEISAAPCTMGLDGNVCQNGGSAVRDSTTGKCGCDCAAGFSEANCEKADPCSTGANGLPCLHGGSITGTHAANNCDCQCIASWGGDNCEHPKCTDTTKVRDCCNPLVSETGVVPQWAFSYQSGAICYGGGKPGGWSEPNSNSLKYTLVDSPYGCYDIQEISGIPIKYNKPNTYTCTPRTETNVCNKVQTGTATLTYTGDATLKVSMSMAGVGEHWYEYMQVTVGGKTVTAQATNVANSNVVTSVSEVGWVWKMVTVTMAPTEFNLKKDDVLTVKISTKDGIAHKDGYFMITYDLLASDTYTPTYSKAGDMCTPIANPGAAGCVCN